MKSREVLAEILSIKKQPLVASGDLTGILSVMKLSLAHLMVRSSSLRSCTTRSFESKLFINEIEC